MKSDRWPDAQILRAAAGYVNKDFVMSVVLQPDRIEDSDTFGVLIDDTSIFNLPILQKLLNQTEESAKKWAKRNGLECVKGRTWIFTGRLSRLAIERAIQQETEDGEG